MKHATRMHDQGEERSFQGDDSTNPRHQHYRRLQATFRPTVGVVIPRQYRLIDHQETAAPQVAAVKVLAFLAGVDLRRPPHDARHSLSGKTGASVNGVRT